MKNKMIVGTILTGMLFMATPVEAMGNAKVEFLANDKIQVGDTFTVSMSVTDIKDTYDGIVSMGGNLSFDSNMVEYVSSKGIETPYLFQMNEDYNYKIAGLDFTLDNGIRDTLTVYEFTFKALQEGNTTITLTNAKLTDSDSYIDTVVLGKEIEIGKKEEEIEEPIQNQTIVYTVPEVVKTEEVKMDEPTTVNTSLPMESTITEEQNIVVLEEQKIEEVKKENKTFVQKVKQIVNDLFSKLRNLFK